ncbi:MAG: hypothetical protein P8X90_24945 [Desulfobacterales bacterium]
MKYFVYFDAYGHAREIISEQELAEKFADEPDEFLAAMCRGLSVTPDSSTTGHVGTLSFDSQKELQEYLEGLGDEITGFYGCRSESRPYNF